jgi:hypothetical protein
MNIIIICAVGILLFLATKSAFESSTNMDFGITRILSAITSLIFIFACFAYYFTRKLNAFFFVLLSPIFLFLMSFGNDIPIFIRIIFIILYFRWGGYVFLPQANLKVSSKS